MTRIDGNICEKGRFKAMDAQTEMIKKKVSLQYTCPKGDFKIPLSGSYNSESAKLFSFWLHYCDQIILDLKYPKAKNKK